MQVGNLLDLPPLNPLATTLPSLGVPPLNVNQLLGVQYLGE